MRDVSSAILGILNEAFAADPGAMAALVSCRVPCNERLAHHPTIQVRAERDGSNPRVGLLGILNGVTYVEGKRLEALFDAQTDALLGFRLVDLSEQR